jgi:hypothetical protein
MKRTVSCIFLLAWAVFSLPAGDLTLKAVEYFDTVFAEWGINEDGTEFEDRFDGMKFDVYRDGTLIGTVILFQAWFKKDPKRYPAIGETITVPEFNFRVYHLPLEEFNLEYDELPGLSGPLGPG